MIAHKEMHELLMKLSSSRRAYIMEALYELGSEHNYPDRDVIDTVIYLMSHIENMEIDLTWLEKR